MTKRETLRLRYLRDSMPVRLGGLAANLARVASFSKHDGHMNAVSASLQESKWFIEWIAPEMEKEKAAELVKLQIQMATRQLQSETKWNDSSWRSELAIQSRQWSERILKMSGLLTS
jgi:hypothetical protein